MGHQRIGTLYASKQWKGVVALITGGASAAEVAAETALAAERSLLEASRNPSLRHAFWLLTQIPLAARKDDFADALRKLGLVVSNAPNLLEIGAAMLAEIDRASSIARRRDDLSELASKAATESLVMMAGKSEESLFGVTYAADEARTALRGLSTNRQFGVLARDFMARLIKSFTSYYLSRALPLHVGTNQALPEHQGSPRF